MRENTEVFSRGGAVTLVFGAALVTSALTVGVLWSLGAFKSQFAADSAALFGWTVEEILESDGNRLLMLSHLPTYEGVDFRERRPTSRLMIRCNGGVTEVVVEFDEDVGVGGSEVSVSVFVADGAKIESAWRVTPDGNGVISTNAQSLATQLAGQARAVVVLEPQPPRTVNYALAGLAEILPRVATACNW